MEKPEIKIVLLDLGGVVFELDWVTLSKNIGQNRRALAPVNAGHPTDGHTAESLAKFIGAWKVYDAYERGHLTSERFFTCLSSDLNFPGSLAQLETHWNELILRPVPGVEALLEEAAKKVELYGLSNTNDAHYRHIAAEYPVLRRLKKLFTSFEFGLRKPEAEIFTATLRELSVEPRALLFIDDSPANVKAAQKLGINAEYCLNSADRMREVFQEYRVID
jgi:HAD superfamily hydrolase (TIGR01509 family)